MNSPWDEDLLRSMRAGDCVAFVGAGFTRPIEMPLWEELIKRLVKIVSQSSERQDLVKYAESCVADKQLPRAASVLRNADTKRFINSELKKAFDGNTLYNDRPSDDPRKKEMHTRLEALTALPWAGYITTNYDTLITEHLSKKGRPCKVVCGSPYDNLARVLKSSDRPFFIHLHGNIASEVIILSEDEYDEVYLGSSSLQSFLRAVLLRYTIVFMGTQVEDRFIELRRQLHLLFRESRQAHPNRPLISPEYVLLSEGDKPRGDYLVSTGGFRVTYYSNDQNKHQGFVPALVELRESLAKFGGSADKIDVVNKRLLEVISRHPDGIKQLEIMQEFWDIGPAPNLTNSELYFRLFYLIYKDLISYNERWQTFRPLGLGSGTKKTTDVRS